MFDLNLGIDSNGPSLQLATLKEYHIKKQNLFYGFTMKIII